MIVIKSDEVDSKLKDYIENLEYLIKNFNKFLKKYSGKYIAIKDGKLIASAKTDKKLFKILKERKIYYAECVIALISKHVIIILP